MEKIDELKKQLSSVMVGKESVIDLVLTSIIAGGHVLVEDMPGTGKTVMAKTLAKAMETSFARIQFTPDLLPADITGLHVYQPQTGSFELKKGPIFAQVILADEINRATPRTQAALLECMEEGQVTLDGVSMPLPQPFFVIATQNPIETAGTFPLPEAQLDRFCMKISMGNMTLENELEMIERFEKNTPVEKVSSVLNATDLLELRAKAREIFIHPILKKYIAEICIGSRSFPKVLAGASPRATLVFMSCVKSYAMLQGREYVVPEDIKKLAEPVLAHRLVLSGDIRRNGGAGEVIRQILDKQSVPTEDWRG